MNNLPDSTEIATIFLDNKLQVRRFTTYVTSLFKLLPHDVGCRLFDIVTKLDYPGLQNDVIEVLKALKFIETTVNAENNRWFKVDIMPYSTHEDVSDGEDITFDRY